MKFCLYLAVAMSALLLPSLSYAQNVRGTVTGNAIQVTITGGYLPVTYLWSNGSTQAGISDLPNGRYCVTVTDALCGTASACFDVEEPCALYGGFEIRTQAEPCQGSSNGRLCGVQSLGRRPPSGVTIATYAWSTGETTNCIDVSTGTYSVTVTDQRGCVGKRTTTVGAAEPIVITETVLEACKTTDGLGMIQLNVAPASSLYTYSWSNGASTQKITGLQPATYSVTVTNSSGCTQTKSMVVGKADMTGDVIVAKVRNNTSCTDRRPCSGTTRGDGEIELEVIKPRNYNYSWTGTSTGIPNAPTASYLCQGGYDVVITIANVPACSLGLFESVCCCSAVPNEQYSCNLQQPLSIELEPKSPSTNGSTDGQIEILFTGGTGNHKIKWTLPDNSIVRDQRTLTGLSQAGKYCVTVNDGCNEITKCVELEICSNITISIAEQITKTCDCTVSPDCNAGKIQLTSVTGGITPHKFKWSSGQTTKDIEDLPKGNYTVTVTTASGCSQTKAFTVGAVATTFVLNSQDCRFYDEFCPMNGKVVKQRANRSGSTDQIRFNPVNCTLNEVCKNGQGIPIEYLIAKTNTYVYNGQCIKDEYCESISTGDKYLRSRINIGFTEQRIVPSDQCRVGENLWSVSCGNKIVGYKCIPQAFRGDDSTVYENNKLKSNIYLFDLLDSSKVFYIILKSVNETTTLAEFNKLMSETQSFNINDLIEYKTRKTFINTSEKAINSLKVFPNPFNQSFTIEIDNQSVSKATISVYNSLGQSVMSNNHNLTKGKNVITIDAKQLNESIYIVEVIDDKGVRMTQKILKSNR